VRRPSPFELSRTRTTVRLDSAGSPPDGQKITDQAEASLDGLPGIIWNSRESLTDRTRPRKGRPSFSSVAVTYAGIAVALLGCLVLLPRFTDRARSNLAQQDRPPLVGPGEIRRVEKVRGRELPPVLPPKFS
jgi:hypothetical protein